MLFEFVDDCGVRLLSVDGGFAARRGCGSLRLPQAVCMCASRHAAVHKLLVHSLAVRSTGKQSLLRAERVTSQPAGAARIQAQNKKRPPKEPSVLR